MNPTGTCYLIECRTGCSCCANENHIRGPFSTKEIADAAVESYRSVALLASQYASKGVYHSTPTSYEQLPDGRLIIGGTRAVSGFADEDPLSDDAIYENTGY